MFGLFKKKEAKQAKVTEVVLYAVADGNLVSIDQVNDVVFAQRMMGDGFAIIPTGNEIVSPVEGQVYNVFPTKHAVGLKAGDLEVLLHMGIDTVALNGVPFNTVAAPEQLVNANTTISTVDLDYLAKEEKDNAMIVIFTNGNEVIENFELMANGPVKKGQVVGKITLK